MIFQKIIEIIKLIRKDKDRIDIPKSVQQAIPVKAIYEDGIFEVSKNKYCRI